MTLPLLNNRDALRGANLCAREILRLTRINLSDNAIMRYIICVHIRIRGVSANLMTFPVNLMRRCAIFTTTDNSR